MAFRKKARTAPESFHMVEPGGATGWGEEMRKLCEDLVSSFDARVARVKALKHETAAMLKGFRDDFRRKAADLKRFFSNAEASRMRDFRAMHQGIMARQKERSGETAELMNRFQRGSEQRVREVGNMLGGFRREQQAAAGHWHNMAATMAKKRASAA